MKKVDAIIRKSQFDDVKSALLAVKVTFLVTGIAQELVMRNLIDAIEELNIVLLIYRGGT